ncbi:MAG: hypothetical protein ACM3JI_02120 [Anaerolineae bacterium]
MPGSTSVTSYASPNSSPNSSDIERENLVKTFSRSNETKSDLYSKVPHWIKNLASNVQGAATTLRHPVQSVLDAVDAPETNIKVQNLIEKEVDSTITALVKLIEVFENGDDHPLGLTALSILIKELIENPKEIIKREWKPQEKKCFEELYKHLQSLDKKLKNDKAFTIEVDEERFKTIYFFKGSEDQYAELAKKIAPVLKELKALKKEGTGLAGFISEKIVDLLEGGVKNAHANFLQARLDLGALHQAVKDTIKKRAANASQESKEPIEVSKKCLKHAQKSLGKLLKENQCEENAQESIQELLDDVETFLEPKKKKSEKDSDEEEPSTIEDKEPSLEDFKKKIKGLNKELIKPAIEANSGSLARILDKVKETVTDPKTGLVAEIQSMLVEQGGKVDQLSSKIGEIIQTTIDKQLKQPKENILQLQEALLKLKSPKLLEGSNDEKQAQAFLTDILNAGHALENFIDAPKNYFEKDEIEKDPTTAKSLSNNLQALKDLFENIVEFSKKESISSDDLHRFNRSILSKNLEPPLDFLKRLIELQKGPMIQKLDQVTGNLLTDAARHLKESPVLAQLMEHLRSTLHEEIIDPAITKIKKLIKKFDGVLGLADKANNALGGKKTSRLAEAKQGASSAEEADRKKAEEEEGGFNFGSVLSSLTKYFGSSASDTASSLAASSLLLALNGVEKLLMDKSGSGTKYPEALQTIKKLISTATEAKESKNWGLIKKALDKSFDTINDLPIYFNGMRAPNLRFPWVGSPQEHSPSAIDKLLKEIEEHQTVRNLTPKQDPKKINYEELSVEQIGKFTKNMSAFVSLRYIYGSVCGLSGDQFYFSAIKEANQHPDKFQEIVKQQLFEQVDQAWTEGKLWLPTVFWARFMYFISQGFISSFVDQFAKNILDWLHSYLDPKNKEELEKAGHSFINGFAHFLANLNGGFRSIAKRDDYTGTVREELKKEMRLPKHNGGLAPKELHRQVVERAVDDFAPNFEWTTSISNWFGAVRFEQTSSLAPLNPAVALVTKLASVLAQALAFLPEFLTNTVIKWKLKNIVVDNSIIDGLMQQSSELIKDKKGQTHTVNTVILEQLKLIWKLLKESKKNGKHSPQAAFASLKQKAKELQRLPATQEPDATAKKVKTLTKEMRELIEGLDLKSTQNAKLLKRLEKMKKASTQESMGKACSDFKDTLHSVKKSKKFQTDEEDDDVLNEDIQELVLTLFSVLNKNKCLTADELEKLIKNKSYTQNAIDFLENIFIDKTVSNIITLLTTAYKSILVKGQLEKQLFKSLSLLNGMFERSYKPVKKKEYKAVEKGIRVISKEILNFSVDRVFNKMIDGKGERLQKGSDEFVNTLKTLIEKYTKQVNAALQKFEPKTEKRKELKTKIKELNRIHKDCQKACLKVLDAQGQMEGNGDLDSSMKKRLNRFTTTFRVYHKVIRGNLCEMALLENQNASEESLAIKFKGFEELLGKITSKTVDEKPSLENIKKARKSFSDLQGKFLTKLRLYKQEKIEKLVKTIEPAFEKMDSTLKTLDNLAKMKVASSELEKKAKSLSDAIKKGFKKDKIAKELISTSDDLIDSLNFKNDEDRTELKKMVEAIGSAKNTKALQSALAAFKEKMSRISKKLKKMIEEAQNKIDKYKERVSQEIDDVKEDRSQNHLLHQESVIKEKKKAALKGIEELQEWAQHSLKEIEVINIDVLDLSPLIEIAKWLTIHYVEGRMDKFMSFIHQPHIIEPMANDVFLSPFAKKSKTAIEAAKKAGVSAA